MEGIITYLFAIAIVVGLMLGWVGIQVLWRRVFTNYISETDVLAERRSCGQCGCTKACEKKKLEHLNG
jgi:hypothetical protein